MISILLSRLVLLIFGTLYPAYASYKTIKTKNVRDYVKWMMYWIVYALYTLIEIFADIFFSFWFPFYYELKILLVLWLMCPITRGSTYIFKKVIHPILSKQEMVIDSYIASIWNQGYDFARKIGVRGLDILIELILDLLHRGQVTAAGFLPKITEIAQNNSVIEKSSEDQPDSRNIDENTFDEEEFDILTIEHPELYLESSNHADTYFLRKRSQKTYHESDNESESEDFETSAKKRPLRLPTKNKDKVSNAVKQKKDANK